MSVSVWLLYSNLFTCFLMLFYCCIYKRTNLRVDFSWDDIKHFTKSAVFLKAHSLFLFMHYLTPEPIIGHIDTAVMFLDTFLFCTNYVIKALSFTSMLYTPQEGLQHSPEESGEDKERRAEWRVSLRGAICVFVFVRAPLCPRLSLWGTLSKRSHRLYLLICDSLFKTSLKLQHLLPGCSSLDFLFNEALSSTPLTFTYSHPLLFFSLFFLFFFMSLDLFFCPQNLHHFFQTFFSCLCFLGFIELSFEENLTLYGTN